MVKARKFFMATVLTLLFSALVASPLFAATSVSNWHTTLYGKNIREVGSSFYVTKGSYVTIKVDQYRMLTGYGDVDRNSNANVKYELYNQWTNEIERSKSFHGNYGGAFGDPGEVTFYNLPEADYIVVITNNIDTPYGTATGGNVYVSK
ncbi:hypothetical protein D3C74_43800 [compost metagenome]